MSQDIRVDVTKRAGVYRANVIIRGAEGTAERAIENPDCTILADSVALVIALSADGAQRDSNFRHDSEGAVAFGVSGHAAALSGTLPRLALGAGADLAVEGLWALRAELSGTVSLPQIERYRGSQVGAQFQLFRLAARVCRAWSLAMIELAPCLGMQFSYIAAEGFGGAQRSVGAAQLFAPTLGVFVRLRMFARFFVRLAVDVAVPLERRRFVYTDLGLLHQPDVLSTQVFLAPEVQF